MDKNIVIMNFSHIYEDERFFQEHDYSWIDCSEVIGTNGYCDEKALEILEQKVQAYSPNGIHFIDSGNYHYISHLWLNKIKEDFILIVFDHHSDMIKPAFGDVLSCGSWIINELENNLFLQKVIIIGISKEQKNSITEKYQDKVKCLCDEDLSTNSLNDFGYLDDLPIYISIDKDVLSNKILDTSWDQGIMNLKQMEDILHEIIANNKVIGLDICGEGEFNNINNLRDSDIVNSELIRFLLNEKEEEIV